MLLRLGLITRVTRFSQLQFMGMPSFHGARKIGYLACCRSSIFATRTTSIGFGSGTPKRYLSDDHKEDYILHQNALTEKERTDIESTVKKDFEDWIPYGFCPTDKAEDIFQYKLFMITSMTIGLVVSLYLISHMPRRDHKDWVTREAYLELERRQRLSLPLVDKNLIPADRILLPSLEELGDDYEIII